MDLLLNIVHNSTKLTNLTPKMRKNMCRFKKNDDIIIALDIIGPKISRLFLCASMTVK